MWSSTSFVNGISTRYLESGSVLYHQWHILASSCQDVTRTFVVRSRWGGREGGMWVGKEVSSFHLLFVPHGPLSHFVSRDLLRPSWFVTRLRTIVTPRGLVSEVDVTLQKEENITSPSCHSCVESVPGRLMCETPAPLLVVFDPLNPLDPHLSPSH